MMKENYISDQAYTIADELTAIYRTLHSQPELSFKEYKTQEYIKTYLDALGLQVKSGIGQTGVTAVIKGELPGKIIAVRADMDALPVKEETGLSFTSQNEGVMHACGHDSHTTILLGVAKLLCKNKARLRGAVKLIFQPAEETTAGAKAVLSDGALKDPDVNMALALHVFSDFKSGHIQVKSGIIMSATDEFIIELTGKGGHGSSPHNAIDPIVAGVHLVTELQTIISRKINPVSPAVVGVCQFISGTRSNIIPENAYISGTIRSQDNDVRKTIFEQIDRITKGICHSFGTKYSLKINEQVPFTINDEKIVDDFITICNVIYNCIMNIVL